MTLSPKHLKLLENNLKNNIQIISFEVNEEVCIYLSYEIYHV